MNRFYEVVFIVRQDAASVLVESITMDITKVIKDSGGDVTKTEFCGVRQFAYPIKKNRKGHYVLLNVSCDGSVIAELERRLRINENVLRYLSVLVDSLDNNPSALMQNRHYRENVSNWGEEPAVNVEEALEPGANRA
jgi:small subunit ribosomal protein S6